MIRMSGNRFVLAIVILAMLAVVAPATINVIRNHAILASSEIGNGEVSTADAPLNTQPSSPTAESGLGAVESATSDSAEESSVLTEDIVQSLFCSRLNEDSFGYQISDVSWVLGEFSGSWPCSTKDALVSFSDSNQCHASHMFELWLFAYSNNSFNSCKSGWKIVKKIADADLLSFEKVDVDGDGIFEVLVNEYFLGNGGHDSMEWKVIRIYGDSPCEVLFQVIGHDDRGSLRQGEVVVWHDIRFMDTNDDGRLEIVDVEHVENRVSIGEGEMDDWDVSSKDTETVWALSGNKYVPVKSVPIDPDDSPS